MDNNAAQGVYRGGDKELNQAIYPVPSSRLLSTADNDATRDTYKRIRGIEEEMDKRMLSRLDNETRYTRNTRAQSKKRVRRRRTKVWGAGLIVRIPPPGYPPPPPRIPSRLNNNPTQESNCVREGEWGEERGGGQTNRPPNKAANLKGNMVMC